VNVLRRGFVYWARLDKRRPVLIVSADRFNSRSSYVTVIPGSTRLRPLVTHIRLKRGEAGLSRPTMLLCEHVQELRASDVETAPLGGPLSRARLDEVEQAIMLYLDIER
jgi:mRNA-degrading endonuclease toxin of MazEF toxin-antitoxin module